MRPQKIWSKISCVTDVSQMSHANVLSCPRKHNYDVRGQVSTMACDICDTTNDLPVSSKSS